MRSSIRISYYLPHYLCWCCSLSMCVCICIRFSCFVFCFLFYCWPLFLLANVRCVIFCERLVCGFELQSYIFKLWLSRNSCVTIGIFHFVKLQYGITRSAIFFPLLRFCFFFSSSLLLLFIHFHAVRKWLYFTCNCYEYKCWLHSVKSVLAFYAVRFHCHICQWIINNEPIQFIYDQPHITHCFKLLNF